MSSEPLRSDELQIEAIDRLKTSSTIRSLLDDDADGWGDDAWSDGPWGGAELGDGGIIPVAIASQRDDLDPRISVGASLDTATPNNKKEDTSGTVRVIVDGTKDYVRSDGTLGLSRIQAAAADAMTTHSPGFYASGLTDEESIAWNESLNRYLGVQQFGFERNSAIRDPYDN